MSKLTALAIAVYLLCSCERTNNQIKNLDSEQINQVCDNFMQLFSKSNFKEGIALLKKNSVIPDSTFDTMLPTIETQISNSVQAYGKITGFEHVRDFSTNGLIIQRIYLLKFEQFFLKFSFTIYRGTKGWTITSFEYNVNLIEVLY
jgi:hypothetical protein